MSRDERPSEPVDPGGSGRTTGVSGTPVAVDVTADVQSRPIWLALLAGPVIWLAHFMLVYLVAEAGCTGDGPGLEVFDPPVPTTVTLAATAVACFACGAAAVWAHRRWRRTPEAGDDADGSQTLAFVGLVLCGFSFVAIVLVGLPAAYLPPC